MRADQDRAPAFFERLIQMLFALEGHLFADHLGMIGEIHELDHAAAEMVKQVLMISCFLSSGRLLPNAMSIDSLAILRLDPINTNPTVRMNLVSPLTTLYG